MLPVGQYQFPFSCVLPDWIPSSFVYRTDWPLYAHMRVKYKAVAKMNDDSGAVKPLYPIYGKRPLIVT